MLKLVTRSCFLDLEPIEYRSSRNGMTVKGSIEYWEEQEGRVCEDLGLMLVLKLDYLEYGFSPLCVAESTAVKR